MKKNLIVVIALVLAMTHIIPPYHIVFANEEENNCENMNFSVQTIKENNESIKGNGFASDQLKVDFITKNQSEIANVNSSRQFELKVEAGYLQANDVIRISNDYYSIEMRVANEEVGSQTIQSQQHLECPVVEEVADQEDVEEKDEITDEVFESEEVNNNEKSSGSGENDKGKKIEEDVGKEVKEESVTEEHEISERENHSANEDIEKESKVGEPSQELEVESQLPESEESKNEVDDEEKVSNSLEENKKNIISQSKKTAKDNKLTLAHKEENDSRDIKKQDKDRKSDEESESVRKIESDESKLTKRERDSTSKEIITADEPLRTVHSEVTSNNKGARLISAELLSNVSLTATHNRTANGKHTINLEYRGSGVLDLNVLGSIYPQFYVPEEIMNEITSVRGTYSVPIITALGLDVLRDRGDFSDERITVNEEENRIYMNYFTILSLSLLSPSEYVFNLVIELDELPSTETGEYVFYTATTQNNSLLDLRLIPISDNSVATLSAPLKPQSPTLTSPVYSNDEVVSGTGEPTQKIIIRIGNEEYVGETNSEGEFTVTIPPQQEGTVIRAAIESDEGYESEEVSVIVIAPLESPSLEPVYSKDTLVTGTALPNHTVIITVNGNDYRTQTNSNGEFTMEIGRQPVGTTISAMLRDESTGLRSDSIETAVLPGTVAFQNVPESITFNTTLIDYALGQMTVQRQNSDWAIDIIDTREIGSEYSVYAEADEPLTHVDSNISLPNALVYVDADGITQPLYGNPVKVHSGESEEEEITTKSWPENRGVMLEVNPFNVQAGSYNTTINWTIVDGP